VANTLGNGIFNPAYWTEELQQVFYRENIAFAIANTKLEEKLHDGDVIHKPYLDHPRDVAYTKGSDFTVQDMTGTDESLTINTIRVIPFYLDEVDRVQNKYDAMKEWIVSAQRQLNNRIEQDVLSNYSSGDHTLDAAAVGGSSGTPAVLTVSNVDQFFTGANRVLTEADVSINDRVAVIGPRLYELLILYVAGKDTSIADTVGENGFVGRRFGFDLIYSNNVPFTATCDIATQVTSGDTVSIQGVTMTFRTTIGSTAASVDIGSDVDDSRNQMVQLINLTGVAGTDWNDVSGDNRWLWTKSGLTATNDDTANEFTVVAYGDLVVAETFTDATDNWNSQQSHPIFCKRGAFSLVTQKAPSMRVVDDPDRLGPQIAVWTLFDSIMWTRDQISAAQSNVDASSWA